MESAAYDPDTFYTELPPGLITVANAARKYGLNRFTIHKWVSRGRVRRMGRLRGHVNGGYVLVSEDELAAYIAAPRQRGGRPRHNRGQSC